MGDLGSDRVDPRPDVGPGAVAAAPLLWPVVGLGLGIRRFWRDSGGGTPSWRAASAAWGDMLTLRNPKGRGIACDGRTARRWFHHALAFGFGLRFAATAIAATGLALLAWRETTAMGMLLAIHLGCAGGFFATLAHGKFAHAPYRAAALLRAAMERQNGP